MNKKRRLEVAKEVVELQEEEVTTRTVAVSVVAEVLVMLAIEDI